MPAQPVRIDPSPISCHPDKVKVAKKLDTVKWSCTQSFTIKFAGGPPITAAGSGSNWTASAGPWDNTTGKEKPLKYTVTIGSDELDPEVDIQP